MAEAQSAINKLKEKTKMEVRALLESAPFAITVRDAPRDYKEQTGCDLPFRKLGFCSAEELFRSMPDTVVITQSVKGPVLKCVANASTQHVERMVRAQRKTVTKSFQLPKEAPVGPRPSAVKDNAMMKSLLGPTPSFQVGRVQPMQYNRSRSPPPLNSRPPPLLPFPVMQQHGYYSHPHPMPPPPPMYNPFMQRSVYPSYQQYPCNDGRMPPYRSSADCKPAPLPAYVKMHVQQLLKNNPTGLSIEVFRLLFHETFHYAISLEHFGYMSIFDVISAMPEIARLKNAGTYLQVLPAPNVPQKDKELPSPTEPSATQGRLIAKGEPNLPVGANISRVSPECSVPLAPAPAAAVPDEAHTSSLTNGLHSSTNEQTTVTNPPVPPSCSTVQAGPVSSSVARSPIHQDCQRAEVQTGPRINSTSVRISPSLPLPMECPKLSPDTKRPSGSATLSHAIGDKMKDTFRQLLEANPNGIWASDLMPKYKKLTSCRLDFREFGFYSIMELVVAIPDIFSIKRSKKTGDCLLLPVSGKLEDTPDSGMETLSRSSSPRMDHKNSDAQTPNVSLQLKKKLMQVICSCPGGALLAEFENTYKVFHDELLNLDSLKHYTAEALFLSLSDIIILDYVDDSKWWDSSSLGHGHTPILSPHPIPTTFNDLSSRQGLKLKYLPIPRYLVLSNLSTRRNFKNWKTILVKATHAGKKLLEVPLPKPEKFRLRTLPSTIAEDAVITPQPVKWQSLPKLGPDKKYIEVYVTYLVNPGNFWVQLRGIDTSVALDDLMNSMRLVYYHSVLSNQYVVPDELVIAPGFYCVALYPADQNWHRAIVSGINSEGTVNVLYVDFGNETTISKTALRLLKREYLKLPAQAIKAKLANIIPIRGAANEWSPASIRRFKELCSSNPLVASVLDSDVSQLSLCLYDTSGDNDVRINDTLVAENHATLAIFQPAVAQYNQLLGRMADPRAELRASMSNYLASKEFERGLSYSQGKPSVGSHGRDLPSPGSSSTDAAELVTSLDEIKPNQAEELAQGLCNIELEQDSYHINEALLIGRTFHVVRLGGSDFIPTFEVSELFWKSDVLRRMVRLTPLSVDFCVIEKASQPVLHRELSLLQKTGSGSDSNLALCPLNRIPDILPLFISNERELLQAFIDLVKLRGA